MIRKHGVLVFGFLITIVFAVSLMVLGGSNTTAHTRNHKTPPETVVYSTFRPANWDVFYFASPGSQPKRLTDDPGLDYDAVLSPDGRWVIFCSERRGNPDLYVLDLKNEGPPKLLIDSEY